MPGRYVVRIRLGETTATRTFAVADARGPRDSLGAVPGVGGGEAEAAAEAADEGEEGEHEAEDGGDGDDGY